MKAHTPAHESSRVRFAELSWQDVAARLAEDCRVVIPLGATEEHGHLSLCTDSLFVERVTHDAAMRAGMLVTPVVPFGCSAFAVNFPGTISLRTETMCRVVEDVCGCLYRQGFRRLVVVTGHGGNEVVTGVLSEIQIERPGLVVHYCNAWSGMQAIVTDAERANGWPKTEHASWNEAFDFVRVGDVPPGSKVFPESPDFPEFPLSPSRARERLAEGVVSGAFSADAYPGLLNKAYEACVEELTAFLRRLPVERPSDTDDA